jgi:hypothetical protein
MAHSNIAAIFFTKYLHWMAKKMVIIICTKNPFDFFICCQTNLQKRIFSVDRLLISILMNYFV